MTVTPQSDQTTMLSGRGIVVRYPGVVALDHVDFDVVAGEVHGLIGENGAGKSTLMKVLSGVARPDEGTIHLNGHSVSLDNPRVASNLGIAMVHQELNLVPHLSVAENVFLGRELVSPLGFVCHREQIRKTRELLSKLDDTIDPQVEVCRLRVGQQQVIEIAKAIYGQARVIFMDEPTSALSESEVNSLFRLIRSLRASGVSIVYVSHKLDELLAISDRITVLRDGKFVQTVPSSQADRDTIVRLMVGRPLQDLYVHTPPQTSKSERLRVDSLTLRSKKWQRPVVEDVSLSAYSGEVLGIFGLMGAGRTELLEAIYGLHSQRTTGALWVDGVALKMDSPHKAMHYGLGLVPEDRKQQGLILSMPVDQNVSLANLESLESAGLLSHRRERMLAQHYVEQFAIKTPTLKQQVRTLSGGNQQKVALSKVLSRTPKILMLDEPTRGIDVSAKREIYATIDRLKREAMAIIVVSSDLPELLGIADRIVVLCEGRKTGEFVRANATEEALMQAAVPGANRLNIKPTTDSCKETRQS